MKAMKHEMGGYHKTDVNWLASQHDENTITKLFLSGRHLFEVRRMREGILAKPQRPDLLVPANPPVKRQGLPEVPIPDEVHQPPAVDPIEVAPVHAVWQADIACHPRRDFPLQFSTSRENAMASWCR